MSEGSAAPAAVGVDVGGTNLRAAVLAADGTILRRVRRPRPDDAEAFVTQTWSLVAELGARDLPLGLGVASIVRGNRVAVHGPNLPIGEVDLVAALQDVGADRVVVENDANAAMWGEWRAGAARGYDHALLLTLGTGVGGGAIVDGRLLRGANGFGGEAGHVPLVAGGRPCACGRLGCLEAYASGGAVAVEALERLSAGRASSLRGLPDLDGAAVAAGAAEGDALAIEVLEAVGTWLGTGLVGMVNLLDPGIVLIGGGAAAGVGRWVLPAAEQVLAKQIEGAARREPPAIVRAELGDDAGIVGAGLLALDEPKRGTP